MDSDVVEEVPVAEEVAVVAAVAAVVVEEVVAEEDLVVEGTYYKFLFALERESRQNLPVATFFWSVYDGTIFPDFFALFANSFFQWW